MATKINDRFNLNLIAEKLENIKIVNKDGSVGFQGLIPDYEELATVIYTSIKFDSDVPETVRIKIIDRAITSAARKDKITEKSLLKEINIAENNYLQQPLQSYILVTSLSIKFFERLSRIQLDDNIITFSQRLPKHFSQDSLQEKITLGEIENVPLNYSVVKVRVKGRSEVEAAEKAFEAIDFLRGIWNFSLNLKTFSRTSFNTIEPINKIRLGPFHTLHQANGKLASDLIWYDTRYVEEKYLKSLENDWAKIRKEELRIRKGIKKISYSEDLKNALIRYANALDETDFESSYLKLWALLESLTGTNKRSYDETIKRTVFLYKEKAFHSQILEHLRTYRNLSVHSDKTSVHIERLVFQLKRYVEKLLLFHLNNAGKFTSIIEAGSFLDISTNPEELGKKIKWLKDALTFQER